MGRGGSQAKQGKEGQTLDIFATNPNKGEPN